MNKTMRASRRKAIMRENLAGYGFISFNMIIVVVFTLFPLFYSIRLSFLDWSPLGKSAFVGIQYYLDAFSDKYFIISLKNNISYAFWTILGAFVMSFSAALAVVNMPCKRLLRTVYFIPSVCSSIVLAMMWGYLYQPQIGLINRLLALVGIEGPRWLSSSAFAPAALYITEVWAVLGYWMIIFLTGLLDIPETYYEAARIDGASSFTAFKKITLPLTSPTIYLFLTMMLITSWQQYDIAYAFAKISGTNGNGPSNSLLLPTYHIYSTAFKTLDIGYAAAMSWLLALLAMTLAFVNTKLSKRWVTYER